MKRALLVGIYENKAYGNCSNNGISAHFDHILLEHPRGPIEIDENNPPENFCRVETRGDYKFIRPVKKPEHLGWMNGGCICYSSDSRFHDISPYPLCFHDRQETQELYNMLSH